MKSGKKWCSSTFYNLSIKYIKTRWIYIKQNIEQENSVKYIDKIYIKNIHQNLFTKNLEIFFLEKYSNSLLKVIHHSLFQQNSHEVSSSLSSNSFWFLFSEWVFTIIYIKEIYLIPSIESRLILEF